MTNEKVIEIKNRMDAFTKETYHKSEVLEELLKLQKQTVEISGFCTGGDSSKKRIYDVEKYLENLNYENGEKYTKNLMKFRKDCFALNNAIRAEISGKHGENLAFCKLQDMGCEHRIIRNLELTTEEGRSEIDAAVITHKGIFIVEVKNTSKDVFIDKTGAMYSIGEYNRYDSNIEDKMRIKERLLRSALEKKGIENIRVFGIVVFTNDRIEVRNKNGYVKTTFLSGLPYTISDCRTDEYYSEYQMNEFEKCLEEARSWETYRCNLKLDVEKYKQDFAVLMAQIETPDTRETIMDKLRSFFRKTSFGYAK